MVGVWAASPFKVSLQLWLFLAILPPTEGCWQETALSLHECLHPAGTQLNTVLCSTPVEPARWDNEVLLPLSIQPTYEMWSTSYESTASLCMLFFFYNTLPWEGKSLHALVFSSELTAQQPGEFSIFIKSSRAYLGWIRCKCEWQKTCAKWNTKKHMVQLLLFYYSNQIWVSAPKGKKKGNKEDSWEKQVHLRERVSFQDDASIINHLGCGYGLTYLWTWGLGAVCLLDGLLTVGRVFLLGDKSPNSVGWQTDGWPGAQRHRERRRSRSQLWAVSFSCSG